MSKELDELERGILEFEKNLEDDCNNEWLKRVVVGMKKCYQRLEAIDNANPSEALECLEEIGKTLMFTDEETLETKTLKEVMPNYYNTINKALLKAQEQEKVLEIIKEKNVDIQLLKESGNRYEYNIHFPFREIYQLTQEEFVLLKRWIEK